MVARLTTVRRRNPLLSSSSNTSGRRCMTPTLSEILETDPSVPVVTLSAP